jgi:hypothetical protein
MTWPQTRPRWALAPHPTPGRAGARPADRALGVDALLAAAFLVDLVTPFLIWKGVLPDAVRWGSHASLAAMMLLAVAHIMQQDRVPGVVLAIVILSAIGLAAGYLRGQGITATAWGWWVMFQFPVVGLYAYTRPGWPARWPETVRRALVIGLAAVVAVQVGQYLTGETPGDNLAGLFGRHGTANLMLYVALVVSVGLGLWLAQGAWRTLAAVLALGMLASVLGEIKMFLPTVFALGLLALGLFSARQRHMGRLLLYVALLLLVAWLFVVAYDEVVSIPRGTRPLGDYLQLRTLDRYLGTANRTIVDGRYVYEIGRNYALIYGWQEIARDPMTLLFGMGLGARGESRTLGSAGAGLSEGPLGLSVGTSMLVMMQELGVVGMTLVAGFFLWALWRLYGDIRRSPHSELTWMRYALILFTLLWPVWLWYTTSWTIRVAMLAYWAMLGMVLAAPRFEAAAERPTVRLTPGEGVRRGR